MKFKVGDKVKVKDKNIKFSDSYRGCTGVINMFDESITGKEGYRIVFDGHDGLDRWVWFDEELVLVEHATFTKSDLKDGMVVEYHYGDRELVFGSRSINGSGWHNLEDYTEDLTEDKYHFAHHAIDKVYEVDNTRITNLNDVFNDRFLTLIWERKPDYKEMTVEEIEKELGYKVKVIADKE